MFYLYVYINRECQFWNSERKRNVWSKPQTQPLARGLTNILTPESGQVGFKPRQWRGAVINKNVLWATEAPSLKWNNALVCPNEWVLLTKLFRVLNSGQSKTLAYNSVPLTAKNSIQTDHSVRKFVSSLIEGQWFLHNLKIDRLDIQ